MWMAIGCVYCGGSHASPGEVRACWSRQEPATSGTTESDVASEVRAEVSAEVSAEVPAVRAAVRATGGRSAATNAFNQRGPIELARGVVISAGSRVPAPWQDAERIVIDQRVIVDPEDTVRNLMDLAEARRPVVIELAVPFSEPPRSTEAAAPYTLGPRFWFPLDVLHHLVWSNAIDATGAEPRWSVLDRAVELGSSVHVSDGDAGQPGDVMLPDGTRAWLDGGPISRRPPIDGAVVLHAVALEHGSLTPPNDAGSAADLAPDQRAAVDHPGAAARIIAPAGSGKTRVLTERARHLLRGWRIPPAALSLVAFNKRAQQEMQARTTDLGGLQVRTLNAIALAIVNGTAPFMRQQRTLRTIDEIEVRRVVGRLVQFPRKRNSDPVAAWIEALSMIRLGLREPSEVEARSKRCTTATSTVLPRCGPVTVLRWNATVRSTSTSRSIARSNCCSPMPTHGKPRNEPAG